MKDSIYEIGIIFRGFTIISCTFNEIPTQNMDEEKKDLRSGFISAISSFIESAFNNCSLEYLESANILFIFKIAEIKSIDSPIKEPFILYGLTEKTKKNPDKFVKKFLEKITPILDTFILKYNNSDFTEITLFQPFKEDIIEFFSS